MDGIFGTKSVVVKCPHCRETVNTKVVFKVTSKTHAIACALCFFCLWPIACVVYCCSSTHDAFHMCPKCGRVVGTYKRCAMLNYRYSDGFSIFGLSCLLFQTSNQTPTAPYMTSKLYPSVASADVNHISLQQLQHHLPEVLQATITPNPQQHLTPPAALYTIGTQPQQQQQNQNPNYQHPEKASVFIVNNGPIPLGRESQKTVCPHCHEYMQTHLHYRSSFRTHIMALVFCFTGLWCLVPLPYCMNSCKRLDHYCNHCKQYVGKMMS